MSVDVKIPRLAESISEAVLVEWLKQDGETVRMDEPVATLETDKAAVEIAAEQGGVLHHAKKAGDRVVVGDVIATIDPSGATGDGPTATAVKAGESPTPANGGLPATQPGIAAGEPAAPLSPAVRRMIEQHGLDPRTIPATGKDGRILKEDVLKHLGQEAGAEAQARPATPAVDRPVEPVRPQAGPATPAAAPLPVASSKLAPATPLSLPPGVLRTASGVIEWGADESERALPMSRIRRRIAERLVEAQHAAAILTTFNEIDMSEVLALRARYRDSFEEKYGVRLGFMSFFARASILALAEVPEINAEIRGGDIVYRRHVHLGVAVGTDRGLVVPVVRHAEALDFAGTEREIGRLAGRARDATLSLDELSGGTFTISNGGVYGSLLSTPILNPPQSGILGMHKIEKRPVVGPNDAVVVRPMMYVALSYDHRIVDGEQAVTFLVRVKERLEDPERMLLGV
jgi:2-oxoglutarate dehydrogenase E2 component (dihydrolipoamide succinyltransferase)